MNSIIGLFVKASIVAAALVSIPAQADTGAFQTKVFFQPSCPSVTDADKAKDRRQGMAAALPLIFGAIAGPLINSVVDLGVNALARAGEDAKVSLPPIGPVVDQRFYSVSPAGSLYLNPNIQCITVIAGHFSENAPPSDRVALPEWLRYALTQGVGVKIEPLNGPPALYFEAEVVRSDDQEYFGLHPRAIYIGEFQQSSSWGRDERSYEITLTYQAVASTTPYASFAFVFDHVHAGYSRVDCHSKRTIPGCYWNAAGSTIGWFQMHPETPDMAGVTAARKRQVAQISLLSGKPSAVGNQGIDTTLESVKSAAYGRYCAELTKLNRSRPSTLYKIDDLCPPTFFEAHALAVNELAKRQAQLDYVDAAILAERKCRSKVEGLESANHAEASEPRAEYFKDFPRNLPAAFAHGLQDSVIESCVNAVAGGTLEVGQFQLNGTITETRYGSAVAKWFAPIAKESSGDIKTALQAELVPAKRKEAEEKKKAAEEAAAAASRSALMMVRLADLDVQIAENDLAQARTEETANQILQKEIALLNKKFAANNAYRAANLPPPYSDVP